MYFSGPVEPIVVVSMDVDRVVGDYVGHGDESEQAEREEQVDHGVGAPATGHHTEQAGQEGQQ